MPHDNLALLGFGNVGKAFARLLLRKRQELLTQYNLSFTVTGVYTARHGAAINLNGLDLERILEALERGESLSSFTVQPAPTGALEFISRCGANVLFENTPVNYDSGQPAVDHLRLALETGMHAITANKGPVVHAHQELSDLAEAKGLKFYFESAVMDGAPIFSLFRETLPTARLLSLRGILNSTTNLILTRMEGGESFEDAVAYAQSIGLAETDPSGDIDGWDAAIKIAALVTVLMGIPLKPHQVEREGIRSLTAAHIAHARQEGRRWKLVCSAQRRGDLVVARVAPEMLPPTSPLYFVDGSSSMVQFETDVLPSLSIVETDPGPETTAYGLLADLINAVKTK